MPVFDAHVCLGNGPGDADGLPNTPALLAEMDRCGVERAVVYHAYAETVSPVDGNELLLAAVRDHPHRLFPQLVALPNSDSIAQLRRAHSVDPVRSVRLHTVGAPALPFADWLWGELLDWLEIERVPLWVPVSEIDLDQLVRTLSDRPSLSIVLAGASYRHAILIRPLLRALPAAHLELSRHETLGDVADLCTEFGTHRLLYGSWYPRCAMGPVLYGLHHGGLDDVALSEVCAGNLDRLLAPVRIAEPVTERVA